LKAYGLWVTQAKATLFKIPAGRIIDGSVKLSSSSDIDARGLAVAKTFTVTLKQGRNDNRNRGTFKLPPLTSGAYLLSLEGGGASARTAFLVTRLGLVAKVSPDSIMLFASDLVTGRPMPGVTLKTRLDDSEASSFTSSDGTVELSKKKHGGLITGISGENLALLPLATEEAPERASEFKGYLYTERTAYRPGQQVFYKGVLRRFNGDILQVPELKTVHIKVTDPGDKVLHETDLSISGKGSFNGSLDLPVRPTLGG